MPEIAVIFIRSVIAFIVLLVLTRIMGKKQLSQLTFFDYIVGITIGSIAATMSVDQNIKISNGLISLIVWGLIPILLGYWGLKSRAFARLTDGRPSIVVREGKVLEDEMKKNQFNINELMMMLREKGVFKLDDVEMAVLETNGELSIMKKTEADPITASLLGMKVKNEHAPALLIVDGHILQENLSALKLDKQWLTKEIKNKGAYDERDVFIAQVDANKQLYVDLYQDNVGKKH
ncbi:DUF421 domain-containing protein [Paenibacillus camelliae]|uniref:DUF421 domain-containing protein n=1 Tax=Paenibacillus camelliae TaxID=512410 RepID=UPI00203F1382|nr:DUF421 domain-containing protein [Paenibacillus camelliae]MCM3635042.1 DUF421 domain-containing protein [Paenibacillus camelliae]